MIQSVALQNFQSHKESILELAPGVNILTGDSDSGKTAILRALAWVLTNRPTGEAFRRIGSKSTSVIVDTSDGAITRVRSDKENLYFGPYAEKLAAIGTSVPESVVKLLNMDADLNIQRQLDAPFLLSCSAGEVAQRLNTVVGLDDIDVGLSNVQRRVRQNQIIFEQVAQQCSALTEQVESFAYLAEMENEVGILEQQLLDLAFMQSHVDGLGGALASVQECLAMLRMVPDVDRFLLQVLDAEQQLQNYNRVYGEAHGLLELVGSIAEAGDALDSIPDVLGLLSIVSDAEGLLQQLRERVELIRLGEDLVDVHGDLRRGVNLVMGQLADHEERLQRDFPAVCPLCGRKGK